MRFGLSVVARGPDANRDSLRTLARRADDHGYDSIWTSDHFVIPQVVKTRFPGTTDGEFPPEWRQGYLAAQSILGYLAAFTERVRIGSSALVVPLRNPIQLAREVATIDVLSNGRVVLGVGTGYSEDEFDVLGIPFAGRGARMDEALRLLRTLWTSDPADFDGDEYSFAGLSCGPRPIQRPHPPILIAGYGRASYRRAARLGDGWHPAAVPPDALATLITELHRELELMGRAPGEVPVSLKLSVEFTSGPTEVSRSTLRGTPDGMIDVLQRYAALGVDLLVLDYGHARVTLDGALRTLDRFEHEVLPRLELSHHGSP